MIFKKLFNLIKNNQNFPYFNFKNKFLIERNNKIKNIFTRLNYILKATTWILNDSINVDKNYNIKNILKIFFLIVLIIIIYLTIIELSLVQHIYFIIWASSGSIEFMVSSVTTFCITTIKLIFTIIFEIFHTILKPKYDVVKSNSIKNQDKVNFINDFYLTRYENILNLVEFNDMKLYNNFLHENGFINFYNLIYTTIKYNWFKKSINNSYTYDFKNNFVNYFQNINDSSLLILLNYCQSNYKFNLNLDNVFGNEFKNKEFSKWLYKYSIIHSRSFFEAQFLNLKLLPLGHVINKTETLNNNNIFNIFFNNIDHKYYFYQNNFNNFNITLQNFKLDYFNNIEIFKNLILNFRFFNLKFKNLTTFFTKNITTGLKYNNDFNNELITIYDKSNSDDMLRWKVSTTLEILNKEITLLSKAFFYNQLNLLLEINTNSTYNNFCRDNYIINNNIIKIKY